MVTLARALKVNEVVEDKFEVTLDRASSKTVIFEHIPTESCNYWVTVDDLSGSFTVITQKVEEITTETEEPETDNGWRIPGTPIVSVLRVLVLILYVFKNESLSKQI